MSYGFFFPVFIGLLIPLLIILIVIYAKTTKLFNLCYVLSVFSYVNLIIYWIDAFELKKNSIIALLVLSAVVMILFGLSLAKSRDKIALQQKAIPKNKNKKQGPAVKSPNFILGWIIPLAVIVILAFAGMFNIGYVSVKTVNENLKVSDLIISNCSLLKNDNSELVAVMTLDVENKFIIPRKVLTHYTVCSENPARNFEMVIYDGEDKYFTYSYPQADIEVSPFEKKNIVFKVRMICGVYSPEYYAEKAVPILGDANSVINVSSLYLINNDGNWIDCNALTRKNKEGAIEIPVKN